MNDKSVASRSVLFALTLAAGQFACAPAQSGNHVAPVITEKVDESQLVKMPGNVRPEALVAANDRGAVAGTLNAEHLLLQLSRSPAAEYALEQRIAALEKPGSPSFHQWMTAEEYGDQFGLADSDLAAVSAFLNSHGLRVNSINTARTLIDFSGTAAQLTEAFHTELHALSVAGVMHIANVSDPQIPAALAPAIVGVVSLHDFRPHTNVKPKPAYSTGTATSGEEAMVPQDLATIYNLNPLFNASTSGQGRTIAVIEDSDIYSAGDWSTFRAKFGLDAYDAGSLVQMNPAPKTGTNNCVDPKSDGGAESEATLDAQWASASAPSATIVVAACDNATFTFGGLIALDNLINAASTPDVVSLSYGECEAVNGVASNAAFKSVFQQAVAEGISVFVSSGDEGAASCDANQASATHGISVSGFASTPYNVAVGGTDFGDTYAGTNGTYWSTQNTAQFGSALSYIPEIPWNNSCASQLFATKNHFSLTYGSAGFCNSGTAKLDDFITTGSGSGGPSGCATGDPATPGLVGGACRGWAKPEWQTGFGVPNDGVRDIPDVSLFAANNYWRHYLIYCDTAPGPTPAETGSCSGAPSTWPGAGGTSFASPIMAGIQALVVQKWGRQGNPNPTYYQLAAAEYGTTGSADCNSTKGNMIAQSCVFNDVTLGDIDVNCLGPYGCYTPSGTNGVLSTGGSAGFGSAFAAHGGWDFATGIGTVNAANLVNNQAWGAGQSAISGSPTHR